MPRDKRKTVVNPAAPEARPEPQLALFDPGKSWQNEWKDMPEFVQNNLLPFKTIKVHFENRADLEKFAELLDQRITMETISIWYPEMEIGDFTRMRWVDAQPDKPESKLPEGTEVIEEG